MILADVNLLVYAFREESKEHEAARAWLTRALRGPEPLALCETVMTGVVRVASNPRIFPTPAPTGVVLEFVNRLSTLPTVHLLTADAAVWTQLTRLFTADPGLRGGHVTDAFLAAMAISHGARLATHDRGMARYQGLKIFDPIAG